ncbi:hypothetical protein [Haloflavibacter putidus]|uniref:Uncharacterized protein n=1 Tax=Haloflavibacter putidus TaxID=2576776 RepID=A0A507ZRJ4_9FLAO|nr:hypothetical protein [Haloflavibacter putidus]TQD40240.1 hypothetical protein FKR84_03310 [Haloflavibacter putidus]
MSEQKKENSKAKESKNQKEDPYNSEITEQEKKILNQENVHKDGGDDEFLRERKRNPDFAAEDLDIPGQERAKRNKEDSKLRDEENDFYSKGGNTNKLEEDNSAD